MQDLARRIEQNPDTALVQTIPMPVRQNTFFGRFVQFRSSLQPNVGTGLSFWQTDSANYWGTTIIRIAPFMQHCGPYSEGRAPFGGEILSHDC